MNPAVAVVTALASSRKASQLYPPTHPAFTTAIDSLLDAVASACAHGPLTLNLHLGHLYDGNTVISEEAPGVAAMAEALEARKIESLTLHPGFGPADAIGLVEVLSLRPSPTLDAEAELLARGVTAVTVAFLADDSDQERVERNRIREQDRGLHGLLIAVIRTVFADITESRKADTEAVGDAVDKIMRRLLDDQAAVLGLATLNSNTENHLFHAVNVMIYSLTLGAALGLPEEGLASLGVSALLHDIGKAAFDSDDPSQAEVMRRLHPEIGASLLSRRSDGDLSPMLVAYEHHMHVDGGGFPDRPSGYAGHPYSRMVAIANRYANLTMDRPDMESFTPDQAIQQILREAGSALDPMFARLFAKAMGVFPVGCLVRLTDQSVGVVCRPGSDPLAPVIRILYDAGGISLDSPFETALADSDLSIVEVVDPKSLSLIVGERL